MEEAMNIAFETSPKRAMSLYTLIISGIQFLNCLTNGVKCFHQSLESVNNSQYIVHALKNFGKMSNIHKKS